MTLGWKLLGEWVKTLYGISTISLVVLSLFLVAVGFPDFATFATILGIAISVYAIVVEKQSQLQLATNMVRAFEISLDKITKASYQPVRSKIPNIRQEFVSWWKEQRSAYALKEFMRQPKLAPRDLVAWAVADWLERTLPDETKYQTLMDFLVYSFLRDNFPEVDHAIRSIQAKYSDFGRCIEDDARRPFYALVFTYYNQNRRGMTDLLEGYRISDTNLLRQGYYTMRGVSEIVNEVIGRLNQNLSDREKARYLLKLVDELRSYLSEKGISLDKFGEAYFSATERAFVIFTAEKKGNHLLKDSLKKSKIPMSNLYFTGPHIVLPSADLDSASMLRQELFPTLDSEYPHVLLIARLAPPDIVISSGKLTPNLKRIGNELVLMGNASERITNYLTLLDKLPKDFVESLHLDFLILSLKDRDLRILREREKEIIVGIDSQIGVKISKLTDFSKLKDQDKATLASLLEHIGIPTSDSRIYAAELVEAAQKWKYVLYGTPTPQILQP